MNVLTQTIELKSKLSYVNQVLSNGGLEAWEAKEYSNLAVEYVNEINQLEDYVENNKAVFA